MGTRVKIGFVIPALGAGGAERVVTTLANGLSLDKEVHIFTYSSTTSFYPLEARVKVHALLPETKPSASPWDALKQNIGLYRALRAQAREIRPDLLIAFLTTANVLTALAGRSLGIPTVISERNNPRVASTPKFWRLLRSWTYPMASLLTAQTEEIASFYPRLRKAGKVALVPNPIAPALTQLRQEQPRDRSILNVGRLTPQKDQALLIRAFARLKQPEWQLYIAGDGPLLGKLEALCRAQGVAERVTFLGRTREIAKYYNQCGIFAFTSRFEGFPNALIEAMHFGMPCIATDCPTGPAELIQDGQNGFLIPMENEDRLVEALEKMISAEAQRKTMGVAAQQSVERFQAEAVIDHWWKILQPLMQHS